VIVVDIVIWLLVGWLACLVLLGVVILLGLALDHAHRLYWAVRRVLLHRRAVRLQKLSRKSVLVEQHPDPRTTHRNPNQPARRTP
jgi:hypothetical protein